MWRLRSGAENLFSRDRVDRDLDDEVRSYEHMLRDENAETGNEAGRSAKGGTNGNGRTGTIERRSARRASRCVVRIAAAGFAIRDSNAAEKSGFRRDRDFDARTRNWSEHGDLQRDSRRAVAGAAISRSIATCDGARHRGRPADGFNFVSGLSRFSRAKFFAGECGRVHDARFDSWWHRSFRTRAKRNGV